MIKMVLKVGSQSFFSAAEAVAESQRIGIKIVRELIKDDKKREFAPVGIQTGQICKDEAKFRSL